MIWYQKVFILYHVVVSLWFDFVGIDSEHLAH